MDDILKYHRLQGRIVDILASDKISSAKLENNTIYLGTESGYLHIVSLGWTSIRSLRLHDRAVNDISSDSHGLNIASCSDNGTVVVYSPNQEDTKEHTVHFQEPLKAVCVEEEAGLKKERSFVVGTASGQLIYHKAAWFAPKNIVLYNGSGSPVTCITWRGVVVAWADISHVRLLDISTQSALCYLDCPSGVNLQCPIPCRMHWESNSDLWIAWADHCRHLDLRLAADGVTVQVKSVQEWHADCIVCGISTFDADHLLLLGYVPPDDSTVDASFASPATNRNSLLRIDEETTGIAKQTEDMTLQEAVDAGPKPVNYPEIQVVERRTGKVISADVLPIRGDLIMTGPWGYHLLCTYQDRTTGNGSKYWSLAEMHTVRGGFKNMTPINYVIAPQDIVVTRVRDVNDRICIALMQSDLLTAANLAVADSFSLTHYKAHDLVSLYVEDLLDQNNFNFAASECARLIGRNVGLWELWICTFIRHGCIDKLLPLIPTRDPQLSQSYYEMVLAEFMKEKDSQNLHSAVDLWVAINPPVFDHAQLLSRLEIARDPDTWSLETQGKLLIQAGKFEDAVKVYLSIRSPRPDPPTAHGATTKPTTGVTPAEQLSPLLAAQADEAAASNNPYYHVFELIDKHELYSILKDRVVSLVRLSKELAGNMLVRCVDRLPVNVVAKQLRSDRHLLHWYLNLLFTRIPEQYNTQEYAEYHIMQVTLYAEFAPKFVKPIKAPTALAVGDASAYDDAVNSISLTSSSVIDTDFLKFLKTSNFAPLEMALKECEKKKPPLVPEIIYILSRTEHHQAALGLLLKEIGDVQQAVAFVEAHSNLQQQLSSDLIEYSLKHPDFLTDLLNYVGISSLNPKEVVSRIPRKSTIPYLRQKLLRIINQYSFQVFLNDKSNSILAHDTLTLLRQLNQGQRRALKVEPNLRCAVCARPLFMTPAKAVSNSSVAGSSSDNPAGTSSTALRDATRLGLDGQVWGNQALGSTGGGVVVYSTKLAAHRYCLDTMKMSSLQQPAM